MIFNPFIQFENEWSTNKRQMSTMIIRSGIRTKTGSRAIKHSQGKKKKQESIQIIKTPRHSLALALFASGDTYSFYVPFTFII